MTYEEFLEKFPPITETPSLPKDVRFRLLYREVYLKLRRMLENSKNPACTAMMAELDKIYGETAELLNLA